MTNNNINESIRKGKIPNPIELRKLAYHYIFKYFNKSCYFDLLEENINVITWCAYKKALEKYNKKRGSFTTILHLYMRSVGSKIISEYGAKRRGNFENKIFMDETYETGDSFISKFDKHTSVEINQLLPLENEELYLEIKKHLSERDYHILIDYYIKELTYDEISKLNRISKQRVEQIVKNSLKKLKKNLNKNVL